MILRESLVLSVTGVLFVALVGGGPIAAWAQTSQAAVGYGEPVAVCEIVDPRLDEASGLAASRRNPGYYYTHNDSRGKPHVYVIDRTGRIGVTIRLLGARNFDWEDIALASGDKPNTYDVCVADIGDNKARRSEIVIYRFPEPEINADARARETIDVRPKAFRCRYEDGPRNAEAFAVHPTGAGLVFSKRLDGTCDAYCLTLPWNSGAVTTLRRCASLKFPPGAPPLSTVVTAADFSPDGTRLVTRSYVGGWEWRVSGAAHGGAQNVALHRAPTAVKLAAEPQGEALCFSADGRALLTISEGTPTTLYEVPALESRDADKP
jgi:hypothetical protein